MPAANGTREGVSGRVALSGRGFDRKGRGLGSSRPGERRGRDSKKERSRAEMSTFRIPAWEPCGREGRRSKGERAQFRISKQAFGRSHSSSGIEGLPKSPGS